MRTFLRVFRFVRPYSAYFILVVAANVVLGMLSALTMVIIKPIMSILFREEEVSGTITSPQNISFLSSLKDSLFSMMKSILVGSSPHMTLLNLSIFIVVVFTVKNVIKYFGGITHSRLSETVVRDMRVELFTKLMNHSMEYFNRNKTGELMALVTNEISTMAGSVVPFFTQLLKSPIEIVLLLTLLLSLSVKLTLIAMSTSILTLFIIRIARKYLRRYATRMADATAGYIGTLQEAVSGIRVVKAFGAEDRMTSGFLDHASSYVRSSVKLSRINESIPVINEIFAITALSVVLFIGGHEVFENRMNGSDLMTFLFALFAIMAPTVSLVSVPGQIQRGIVAAERVFALIDLQPTIKDGSLKIESFTDAVSFNKVSFAYNQHSDVLHDVSLRIPRGKKIALVGASGSGKSTLIDILVRFYDPQTGSITVDGRDIRSFTLQSYRSRFGIVSQEATLFNDTIARNIAFGSSHVSIDQIIAAAKIAHADEFISVLPEGYDTFVGDRGILLSGGQRQRIAIARAVVLNPDILVFDEATSALDSASEKIVQSAINDVLRDRTAVIIAHRLSTIIDCDDIIVFDSGRIAEQGTHKQLIEKKGIYKRLYDIQYAEQSGVAHESQ